MTEWVRGTDTSKRWGSIDIDIVVDRVTWLGMKMKLKINDGDQWWTTPRRPKAAYLCSGSLAMSPFSLGYSRQGSAALRPPAIAMWLQKGNQRRYWKEPYYCIFTNYYFLILSCLMEGYTGVQTSRFSGTSILVYHNWFQIHTRTYVYKSSYCTLTIANIPIARHIYVHKIGPTSFLIGPRHSAVLPLISTYIHAFHPVLLVRTSSTPVSTSYKIGDRRTYKSALNPEWRHIGLKHHLRGHHWPVTSKTTSPGLVWCLFALVLLPVESSPMTSSSLDAQRQKCNRNGKQNWHSTCVQYFFVGFLVLSRYVPVDAEDIRST